MSNHDLKPCPCGFSSLGIIASIDSIVIFCPHCGRSNKTYGKKASYESIANCKRYVWPLAVKQWNNLDRRASDGENA